MHLWCLYFIQNSGGYTMEHHQPVGASDHVLAEDHGEDRLWHRKQWIQGDWNLWGATRRWCTTRHIWFWAVPFQNELSTELCPAEQRRRRGFKAWEARSASDWPASQSRERRWAGTTSAMGGRERSQCNLHWGMKLWIQPSYHVPPSPFNPPLHPRTHSLGSIPTCSDFFGIQSCHAFLQTSL